MMAGSADKTTEAKSFISGRNDGLSGTAQATTEYFFPSGFGNASATEADRESITTDAFDGTKLIVKVSQNNVDNPSTITVRKNGVDTGLSVSVSGNTTGTFVSEGRENFTSQDMMSLEVTAGGGATGDTLTVETWSIQVES